MVLYCYKELLLDMRKDASIKSTYFPESSKELLSKNIGSTTSFSNFFENYAPSELTDSYRLLSTPSNFAKSTLLYIQEIGKLKSLKSHISQREKLDSFLFIIVLSGSGTFSYEGCNYFLEPGDHVFIDCKKLYSHKSSEDNPWELIWVHFNGVLMDQYYTYFTSITTTVVLHPKNPLEFDSILEHLMELTVQKRVDSEILVSHILNGLVTKILTLSDNQSVNNQSTTSKKMEQIKSYIDKNFQKDFSLDILAQIFFTSKYHMSREFKKAYGDTVINYIINTRITHAKQLLRFTDMQIEDIGRKCGIKDRSYFNKVFRKIEGITASEYRKKWKNLN